MYNVHALYYSIGKKGFCFWQERNRSFCCLGDEEKSRCVDEAALLIVPGILPIKNLSPLSLLYKGKVMQYAAADAA